MKRLEVTIRLIVDVPDEIDSQKVILTTPVERLKFSEMGDAPAWTGHSTHIGAATCIGYETTEVEIQEVTP